MISVEVVSSQTMSGKSSDGGGYTSVEQSIVQVSAKVMLYDDVSRQWMFSSSCSSPSKVHIYQHMTNNSFRVVGRSVEDRTVTINCLISGNLRYNQATPVFHQWRDGRQIYGLQFLNKEDADDFANAMIASLELLNLGSDKRLNHQLQHQQDHHHRQQLQQSTLQQQQQQQTITQRSTPAAVNVITSIPQTETYDSSRGYRNDHQHGGRGEPETVEVDHTADATHDRSEVNLYHRHHHHHHQQQQQQQQQQEVQSSPLPSSQTNPLTPAARNHPPSLSRQQLSSARASTNVDNNHSATSCNSSDAPSDAATTASAPPPPPPPPPPAVPLSSQTPAKPAGIDLASALKGVKLRETTKTTETKSNEAKTSGLETMTLGRASKVVPICPPGHGTATVGRSAGGPPPATRPKLNVLSEMEKKLKERKEKSEGATIATEQQIPKRGAIGLQDLFQGNQPQQKSEEVSLQSLSLSTSSAEDNIAIQRIQEVGATRGGAAALSAVSSPGNNSRSVLPADLETIKVELVMKIKQELENTKEEILNAFRCELRKQLS